MLLVPPPQDAQAMADSINSARMIADLRLRSINTINPNPTAPSHTILRASGPSGGIRRDCDPGGTEDGAVVKMSTLTKTGTTPLVGTVDGG